MNLNSFEYFSDFWNDHAKRVEQFVKENGEEKLVRGIFCDCRGTMYIHDGFTLNEPLRARLFQLRDQKGFDLNMTSSLINGYRRFLQRDGLPYLHKAHDAGDLQDRGYAEHVSFELSINDQYDPGVKYLTTIHPRDFLALKM